MTAGSEPLQGNTGENFGKMDIWYQIVFSTGRFLILTRYLACTSRYLYQVPYISGYMRGVATFVSHQEGRTLGGDPARNVTSQNFTKNHNLAHKRRIYYNGRDPLMFCLISVTSGSLSQMFIIYT